MYHIPLNITYIGSWKYGMYRFLDFINLDFIKKFCERIIRYTKYFKILLALQWGNIIIDTLL